MIIFARLVIFDMLLTALVTAALLCLLQGRRTGDGWQWWPLAGFAMGLAVLCKGPVGAAVPLLAWAAARGALPPAPRRAGVQPAIASAAVFMATVLPWIVRVHTLEPGFLHYALIDETLQRFTSAERFNRAGPPYYYAVVLTWAGGAWGAVLVAAAPALWRRWRAGGPDAAPIAFAIRAAGAILLLFSVSASKRPQYILPALVPLALLVAIGVAAAPARLVGAVRALSFAAIVVGVPAAAIAQRGFAAGRGDLGYLSPGVLATAGLFLVAWGIVSTALARRPASAFACAALFGPLLGHPPERPPRRVVVRSSRDLAAHIPSDAKVVCAMEFRTSLPFYLRRPVVLISSDGKELTSNYVLAMQDRLMGDAYLQPPARLNDGSPTISRCSCWSHDGGSASCGG